MNQDFLIHVLIGSFICTGIWSLFGRGMIFEKVGDYMESRIYDFINKPLWMCLICMASVHGTWMHFLVFNGSVIDLPLFCLALCGLNKIIASKL